MQDGVARILYKLDYILGLDGATVLHSVEELGIEDEDGELGAGPILSAKLFGTVWGGVPAVDGRHQQVRVGEVVGNLLNNAAGLHNIASYVLQAVFRIHSFNAKTDPDPA